MGQWRRGRDTSPKASKSRQCLKLKSCEWQVHNIFGPAPMFAMKGISRRRKCRAQIGLPGKLCLNGETDGWAAASERQLPTPIRSSRHRSLHCTQKLVLALPIFPPSPDHRIGRSRALWLLVDQSNRWRRANYCQGDLAGCRIAVGMTLRSRPAKQLECLRCN